MPSIQPNLPWHGRTVGMKAPSTCGSWSGPMRRSSSSAAALRPFPTGPQNICGVALAASGANSQRLLWKAGLRRERSLALHFALAELEEQRNNLSEARKAYEDAITVCSDRVKALLDAEATPAEGGGKAAQPTDRELEAGRAAQALSLVVINYMRFARRNPVRRVDAINQLVGRLSLTAAGRAHLPIHSDFQSSGADSALQGVQGMRDIFRRARRLPPAACTYHIYVASGTCPKLPGSAADC